MPLTELRIQGLRTIENIRLSLDGLTVLIGDNGSGKSSILEACELLRRAMGPRFMEELYSVHGGLSALLRQGARELRLGVTVTPAQGDARLADIASVDYEFSLAPQDHFAVIQGEELWVRLAAEQKRARKIKGGGPGKSQRQLQLEARRSAVQLLRRSGAKYEAWEGYDPDSERFGFPVDANALFMPSQARGPEASGDAFADVANLVASHLSNIFVHLPFEVLPAWAARSLDRKSALRGSTLFAPADNLSRLGANLANAYHALKNTLGQKHWQQTLGYIRLGLGERVEDVTTWADPGGGNVGLSIKWKDLEQQIPAAQLSDGMLAFLGFVALYRLHRVPPALVAFDEPDLHLHPQLLMRVLDFFEDMARRHPVLLATHSDRLLDGLSDPARSVVLCELDERNVTRLVRPDPEALARWLERYRGIGEIRSAGHEASVLTRRDEPR